MGSDRRRRSRWPVAAGTAMLLVLWLGSVFPAAAQEGEDRWTTAAPVDLSRFSLEEIRLAGEFDVPTDDIADAMKSSTSGLLRIRPVNLERLQGRRPAHPQPLPVARLLERAGGSHRGVRPRPPEDARHVHHRHRHPSGRRGHHVRRRAVAHGEAAAGVGAAGAGRRVRRVDDGPRPAAHRERVRQPRLLPRERRGRHPGRRRRPRAARARPDLPHRRGPAPAGRGDPGGGQPRDAALHHPARAGVPTRARC